MTGRSTTSVNKFHRTRTGCYTCRKRRCDENKPICMHCKRGSRDCTFPVLDRTSSSDKSALEGSKSIKSPESIEEDHDSEAEVAGSSKVKGIVRYPSATIRDSLIDGLDDLECNRPDYNDFLALPLIPEYSTSTPTFYDLYLSSKDPPQSEFQYVLMPIPRQPKSGRQYSLQYFLRFNLKFVTFAHNFLFYDHRRPVFALSEQFEPLQCSMAAFSALVYSIKFDTTAREQAFVYYAKALTELRELLERPPRDMEDYHGMVATVLQLSTFDRFFGDDAKCFRHVQGTARIMQAFSNPIQHCSTIIGRSLLEWYATMQDYCCFSAAFAPPLPRVWQDETIRIRQVLAHYDYPRLSPTERLSRLLDDLWAQLRGLLPRVNDIQAALLSLNTLEGQERVDLASRLESDLKYIINDFTGFLDSRHVVEVFQPAPTIPYVSTHSTCCPIPPFSPYVCKLPIAGYFRMILHGLLAYLRAILHPFLLAEVGRVAENLGVMEPHSDYHATELCRSFAGFEEILPESQGWPYPCYSPMVSAALTCPPSLREWVWFKLVHFESLGQFRLEPIKRNLAVTWDMPELIQKDFRWKRASQCDRRIAEVDEVDIVVNFEKVILQGESQSSDDELESLTRLRGLFGITQDEAFSEGIGP